MLGRPPRLNQFERRLIQERPNADLSVTRARGQLGGRPALPLDAPRVQTSKKLHADKSMVIADICTTLQISWPALYSWSANKGVETTLKHVFGFSFILKGSAQMTCRNHH